MDVNNNIDNRPSMKQEIKELRNKFLTEFDSHPDLYDPCDRALITTGDLWVRRFLTFLDQGPERALDHMIETFRWRKSYAINSFDHLEIPREVWLMAPLFEYYPDGENCRMLYVRVKMHRRIPQIMDRIKKYFMYRVERMDRSAGREHGFNIVFDMSGCSYANADLDLLFFILPSIRKYYPNAVKHVYVLGLPWILNSFAKFALALIPSDTANKIKFLTHEEFKDLVPIDRIPDFLGGKGGKNYRRIPKGAKPCLILGPELLGLTEAEVTKMLKPSLKHIAEGNGLAVDVEDYENDNEE